VNNIVPDWFKKTSIYQINPRTFSAEGTINAVTKELPFLAELGFGVMYLCPIFDEDDSTDKTMWSERQIKYKTDNPKNPYRINDYFEIDSEYGNMQDLREFVSESHRLGMRVILDLVYYHIGPNAKILKTHPEFAAKNEDGSIKLTSWNFPCLNYQNEGLREYLWCNMTYYVGVIGVDGYRCDVGDAVPLDFWSEAKRRIKAINPEAIMINEGQKPEYLSVFDANYGFSWHNSVYDVLHHTITTRELAEKHKEKASQLCDEGLILRDMDNHDTVTDWPYRIEEHFGSDCMEAILSLNYVIDGIPMVYCGNELADKARLNMFANRFHRGSYDVTDRTVNGTAVERRKKIIKELNALRTNCTTLQNGKTKWYDSDFDWVVHFSRVSDEGRIAYIGNFGTDEIDIDFNEKSEILLSKKACIQKGHLKLQNYGYIIYIEP